MTENVCVEDTNFLIFKNVLTNDMNPMAPYHV